MQLGESSRRGEEIGKCAPPSHLIIWSFSPPRFSPCRLLLVRSVQHREPLRVEDEEDGDEEQPELLLICSQVEENFFFYQERTTAAIL